MSEPGRHGAGGGVAAEAALPFVDLRAQRRRLGAAVDAAIARVLEHGRFIMGPEVAELERVLAALCGAGHAITCASGTDALALALMAKGVGPRDAVLVPSFTFVATAEVVVWLGATPVFVDVLPDSFNLDPAAIEGGVAAARAAGLTPRAVIAVDLFGQPADYGAIEPACAVHDLWLMVDAAQSFGAAYKGRRVGRIGAVTATSFFPTKPLGCYGDGGCVFTDDGALAETIRSLRNHGQGRNQYDNVRVGMNGRFDTLQAAILLEKLKIFPDEVAARRRVAERYHVGLRDVVRVPEVIDGAAPVWAQYTVVAEQTDRDAIAGRLRARGIPSAVYYPRPLHLQPAYRGYPVAGKGATLPAAERLAARVLSLPMHPYLDAATQDSIIEHVRAAVAAAQRVHPCNPDDRFTSDSAG